jgi:Icc-related predicted phosphoesterase
MMRILFSSDLHGHPEAYRKFAEHLRESAFYAGVLAGDLMTHVSPAEMDDYREVWGLSLDLSLHSGSRVERREFFKLILAHKSDELQSILSNAEKPVFFIMGNDDGILEGGLEWPSSRHLFNIHGNRIEAEKFNFVGYQFTPPFVGGLYEKTEEEQAADLLNLGGLVDEHTVLVTHGPPRGILDDDAYGSTSLRDFVDRHPPRLHLFGHIHQAFGRRGRFINGAFPTSRRFVGIDLDTLKSEEIPVTL